MAVAAAATGLPRWDTLVFTGGIGEHSPVVNEEICQGLVSLRPPLPASSATGTATGTRTPTATSAATGAMAIAPELSATGLHLLVVPNDEAGVMDRETRALLGPA